jgi:hypothetical protein
MMVSLGAQNLQASATIREVYREHLDLLVFDRYDALEDALGNGGLAPLPSNLERFNLAPRLDGLHPIGEKDLDNQVSYLAARPATIGCLLEVASRVKSGPIEVTSLVRHSEYQDELRSTNANANATIPMHTMGLAFDIAIVNTPLATVFEIRDVLRQMRDAGDILFIGERRQLVFHVVPHPSRLGHFTDVYTRALSAPPTMPVAQAIAASVAPNLHTTPTVTAEIGAILPTPEFAREWWAAEQAGDVAVEISAPWLRGSGPPASAAAILARIVALLIGLLLMVWRVFGPHVPLPALPRPLRF